MSSVNLPITPPSLPANYCYPDSPQQLINDGVGGAVVNFDTTGATLVLKQASQPLNTQRDRLWFNVATGHTLYYEPTVTSWVQLHPLAAGGIDIRMVNGTVTNLDTYDGGSPGMIGDVSGPMWIPLAGMAGRLPWGAGALPDVVNGDVTIVAGANGGHNELVALKDNLPKTTLYVQTSVIGQASVTGSGGDAIVGSAYGSDPISGAGGACDATDSALSGRYYTRAQTEQMGQAVPLNIVPPYFGVLFIQRSARRFYTT